MSLIKVPVVEVTLQEDRAIVRREGEITMGPGRSVLRIEGVAPVLVDQSLYATLEVLPEPLEGEARPVVRSINVTRCRVTNDAQRPEVLATVQDQLRQRRDEHNAVERRHEQMSAEHDALHALFTTTVQELVEDAGWGTDVRRDGHATLDGLGERLIETGAQQCELDAERQRLEQEIADLTQLERLALTVEAVAVAALELEVYHPGPAPVQVRLRVDYLVPGALWRPWHRARLVPGPDDADARIMMQCQGCVWQATGEDWNDVQLWFSTERASLGLTAPSLQTDVLALRKRDPNLDVEVRQQEINTTGLGQDPNIEASASVLGIDDGGATQRLRGLGRTSIPGDGRPHRVPLFEWQSPATLEHRGVAELTTAVILRSEQTNCAPHPLLAGPVDLVRDSGVVGRTSVLYVAPGERFALGWGPDPALRITRDVEYLPVQRKPLGSWTKKPRRVRIRVSNLGASERRIRVFERIVVSEIEEVKVEVKRADPPAQPDRDGLVVWELSLPGFGRQTLTLEWVLVVHDHVQGV